ncbi:MAG: replication protein [Candidatus Xenobiia bacterium LiM19]
MANPQLEKGYVKIANELMEAFAKTRMPGSSTQVLMAILRESYGYNQKTAKLSMDRIAKKTGLHRSHVARALKVLLDMKIVTKIGNSFVNEWRVNKDYETWKTVIKNGNIMLEVLPELVTGVTGIGNISEQSVTGIGNKTVTKNGNTRKDIKDKDKYKDIDIKKCDRPPQSSTSYPPHFEEFWKVYPRQFKKDLAWENYQACMKAGVPAELLLKAATNFAMYCRAEITETRFINLASNFLGKRIYKEFTDDEKVKAMTRPVQDINARRGVGQPSEFVGGVQKL